MSLILHLIVVFAIGFTSSHAQAHTQAVQAPSQALAQAPTASPLAYVAPKLAARQQAQVWASLTLAEAGVKLSPSVTLEFTNEDNCGAKLSTASLGGCTHTITHLNAPSTYTVQISPELAYTAWGNHILFHELAHTMGADECGAETYAHHFEDEPLWGYPSCKATK